MCLLSGQQLMNALTIDIPRLHPANNSRKHVLSVTWNQIRDARQVKSQIETSASNYTLYYN